MCSAKDLFLFSFEYNTSTYHMKLETSRNRFIYENKFHLKLNKSQFNTAIFNIVHKYYFNFTNRLKRKLKIVYKDF